MLYSLQRVYGVNWANDFMNYEIIEDCSPYYIRFTHDGLYNIIDLVGQNFKYPRTENGFEHIAFSEEIGSKILTKVPFADQLKLMKERVSLFFTRPGHYYRAHKDGNNNRFSINYTVLVADDKCVTSWYGEELKDLYPVDTHNNTSRECEGFIKDNHIPLKTMTAQPNECILFNTEIYHDWDNSKSTNNRVILTLRTAPTNREIYFEDVRKILFNY